MTVHVQASRRGKKHLGAYVDLEPAGALKLVALARGTTIQDIIKDGIEVWLKKENLPSLADLPGSPEVVAFLARIGVKATV